MKRDQLKKLLGENATDELIDAIMKLHGESIEAYKTTATDLQKQLDTANAQLAEANKQIDSFKGMDIETIKKTADEYKTKFEQAQEESKNQLAALKFDHALDTALGAAKAKNPKAVKALLEMQNLKLNDADGSIIGLEDQLKTVKEKNDYLFESDEETPEIVTKTNNSKVTMDAFEAAMWKGAGIEPPKS